MSVMAIFRQLQARSLNWASVPGSAKERRLRSGFDVVVHAKEIRRIVLIFYGDQAVVIRPVGCTGERIPFVRDVIAIRAFDEKRA